MGCRRGEEPGAELADLLFLSESVAGSLRPRAGQRGPPRRGSAPGGPGVSGGSAGGPPGRAVVKGGRLDLQTVLANLIQMIVKVARVNLEGEDRPAL